MTIKTIGAIFNVGPDGSIVIDGDHAPGVTEAAWELLGITAQRIGPGQYVIAGPSIAWPPGHPLSIYQDANGDRTSWVQIGSNAGGLTIDAYDPADHSKHADITYLLTVSVRVTLDIDDTPPALVDTPDSQGGYKVSISAPQDASASADSAGQGSTAS